MTLDELLNALFPAGHDTQVEKEGILHGTARYGEGKTAAVLGVANHTPLGVNGALALGSYLLGVIRGAPGRPIAVLIDAQSQRMRRRDGIGAERKGHLKAAAIARRVVQEAAAIARRRS
jgi:malonate decarboxylase gamma subunit